MPGGLVIQIDEGDRMAAAPSLEPAVAIGSERCRNTLPAILGKNELLVAVYRGFIAVDPDTVDVRRRAECHPLVRHQTAAIKCCNTEISASQRFTDEIQRQLQARVSAMRQKLAPIGEKAICNG